MLPFKLKNIHSQKYNLARFVGQIWSLTCGREHGVREQSDKENGCTGGIRIQRKLEATT